MEESELFMILVSSCLLGNNVKYSGGSNGHELLMKYRQYLTAVCPECLGELPIPRRQQSCRGVMATLCWLAGQRHAIKRAWM